MTVYRMTAEENYDDTRIAAIEGLSTYTATFMCTDQNYQGVQWDAVRRNLMYMYVQNIPSDPNTNTTGHKLWDGETAINTGGAINTLEMFNSSVGVKNIDTGDVTFYSNYSVDNLVPNGIGGGDGTWRRYTHDFHATSPQSCSNGPGMTDPNTGNFWINGESCILYCFRLEDDYSQVISPLRPVIDPDNIVQIVGFTDDWAFAREIDETVSPSPAHLYLTPREFTATEITADELLIYATFDYPVTAPAKQFHPYNREIFDHAGNVYLFSCTSSGGKDFKLYRFEPPSSAPYGGPTVGGGFAEITPWGSDEGPNEDADDYDLLRLNNEDAGDRPHTPSIIPLYLPVTDELVLIEKFFPSEHTADSIDPALMKWSCTYVGDITGSPTFDHHSAFVTGYMSENWTPTDINGAAYAVVDAFEVNNYLGQAQYLYDIDYTTRWFFFLCTKMVDGVSDGKARIVLVEYSFVNGSAPSVVQVIDEQGWDDTYPDFAEHDNEAYLAVSGADTSAAVATAMQTVFNYDALNPMWDSGIYDPETRSFWWSGGGSGNLSNPPFFSLFDDRFYDRTQNVSGAPSGLQYAGATPPFLKLRLSEGDLKIRVWAFSLDGHDFYCLRLGNSETLVYDLTTDNWSHWASPDSETWRAHIGQNWVGAGADTMAHEYGSDVVAGDDSLGILWMLDPTAGQDDDASTGDPTSFTRKVTGELQLSGRDVLPCGAVTLDLSLGAPIDVASTISLKISDNLGHTYTDLGSQTLTASDFSSVVEWRGLGLIKAPGRLFQIVDDGAAIRISAANLR